MRVYSAGEAIGPAWERTIDLLWRPRRWGTLLKVGLVALVAEIGGGLNLNLPGNLSKNTGLPAGALAALAGVLVFVALLSIAIALVMFYVSARMQFVLFELVARQSTVVAPAWRFHGARTWRWIGLKLLLFMVLLIAAVPVVLPLVLRMMRLLHQSRTGTYSGGTSGIGAIAGGWTLILSTLIGFILPVLALVLVAVALYWLLRDFALPSIALEDVSIGEAVRRVWGLLRAEPGAVLLYVLLRFLVGTVAGLTAYLAVILATLVSALPFTLIGALVWYPLHSSTSGRIFAYTFIGLLFGMLLVWFAVLLIAAMGTVLTFYQAWSEYFLGGRYPLLGDLLEHSVAVPVWTPPPSIPREEDDDGPGFPMDPVPA